MSADAKPKWKLSAALMPPRRICSRVEAIAWLGRKIFDDAITAGWLQPCALRKTPKDAATKIYSVPALDAVAARIERGEYPA